MITIKASHARTLREELREMWVYRDTLLVFSMRTISVRYKQALIGIAWVVVQPVATSAIFTVVFSWLARIPSEGVPYPIFVFSGLLIWQYFSKVITEGTSSLVNNANIITKVYFPRLLIPLSVPVVAGVDFLIGFGVLLLLMLIFSVAIYWTIFLVPVALFMAGLLAYGITLWFAPLNALYRDVGHALPFVMQIAMFLSPVIYPVSFVPEKYRWVFDFNPVATVINFMRWALLGGERPSALAYGFFGLATAVIIAVGFRIFRSTETSLVDRI